MFCQKDSVQNQFKIFSLKIYINVPLNENIQDVSKIASNYLLGISYLYYYNKKTFASQIIG